MPGIKPLVTGYNFITAYGEGVKPCWDAILANKSSIDRINRFSTRQFQSANAAVVNGLEYQGEDSLAIQMLRKILKNSKTPVPTDAALILATTTGEIDILEKYILSGSGDAKKSKPVFLLEKIKEMTGIKSAGMVMSSACASSSAAIGFAAGLIQEGKQDCVLIAAVDAVTEFVFSGFSSLMALDRDKAKPFDRNRAGLSLGEGAGFVLLMSEKRAEKEAGNISGEVAGWAIAGDANHMTGPSRDGNGLSIAIQKAIKKAGISDNDIGCISSHGTGTVYNDSMEMKAYKSVFAGKQVPLYSIKGATGHTMGAAGLIETIIALKVLREKVIPQTVGLKDIDPEAEGWVSLDKQKLEKNAILLNNAGFGGVNAALVLR